ncbi:unnamed protein product [Withania somnifera]
MEHPFFINNVPTSNRPEALRLLSIAEKLLTNRDLVGSKSFATRARESDPTLSPVTDQILGTVDALIASEKRINNHHFDYYSILQIPNNQTQNTDFIAEQYRRLALLLNPQTNSFPFSDQAFRIVVDAFAVLSNPLRKSMYDKELGFFVNLYSVAASGSTPTPMNFGHQNFSISMPTSNADQVFVNMPSQDQVSNAAGVSFSRDPQPGISMPVTASSNIERQQPVTFLRQQTQPVSCISFSKADEQPATFLNLNQPQPVNSVRNLNRENPPQGREQVVSGEPDGSQQKNPPQGREQVVSGEQDGNQQAAERNENVVGSNAGKAVSTSDNVKEKEGNADGAGNKMPSFWTACPYCLIMYEYSVDYIGCNLRCQNCKKAFQAVAIASPPPIIDGKEVNFCSWGFMPFGLSVEDFDRSLDDGSSWSPFSPMFTCPQFGGNGGSSLNNNAVGGQRNVNNLGSSQNAGVSRSGGGKKHSATRIYVLDDGDDAFVEVPDSGEESDEDWDRDKERKKTKKGKRKSSRTATASKSAKKQRSDKAATVEGNNDVNLQDGLANQGGVEMSRVVAVESSKRGVAGSTRRQPGKVAKHFGNLDLNVEFSNEVEEPKIQMSGEAGEGEDNTVEVIGFFEGLDEFLNSLPILNAVDGDKVEAA